MKEMINLRSNYPFLEDETSLLQNCFHALKHADVQHCLLPPPWRGLPEDRAVAAQWLSTQGGQVADEVISICSSSHHALGVLAFAAQLQGATIATDPFTYPGLKAIAKLFHLQLVPCETDGDGMQKQEGSAYVRLSLGGETIWSRLEQGIRLFLEEVQKPIS